MLQILVFLSSTYIRFSARYIFAGLSFNFWLAPGYNDLDMSYDEVVFVQLLSYDLNYHDIKVTHDENIALILISSAINYYYML